MKSPTGRTPYEPNIQNIPPALTDKEREEAELIKAALRAMTCAVCDGTKPGCPHCQFVWRPK